jgi:hypothetical protein
MFNQLPAPLNIAQMDAGRVVPFKGWDVYQDVFFSTLVYPQAGQPVGNPLVFFAGSEGLGNTNLTNVSSANALIPGGHRFHGLKLFLIPMIEVSTVAVAATLDGSGRVRDVDRVVKTNRPLLSYTSTRINKSRGTIPLDFIGEAGGILPDFGGNNVPAAGNNAVYQHVRTAAIGGWPVDLIVNENEGVQVNISWGVQTAIESNLSLRVALLGWHYVQAG